MIDTAALRRLVRRFRETIELERKAIRGALGVGDPSLGGELLDVSRGQRRRPRFQGREHPLDAVSEAVRFARLAPCQSLPDRRQHLRNFCEDAFDEFPQETFVTAKTFERDGHVDGRL